MSAQPIDQALSLSAEEILRGILRISSEAIIVTDEATRILLFSAGAESAFGYSSAEVLGTPIERLLPARFRAAHTGHVETFAGGSVETKVMRDRGPVMGLRKSGEEFPVEAALSKRRTPQGLVFTAIVRDISERRRAEAVLAEARDAAEEQARKAELSEAGFRGLADNVTDIILRFGPDGLIRYISAACRVLGLEPEEQVGQSIAQFMAPEEREHLPAILSHLFSGADLDPTQRRIYKLRDRSGREVSFESNPRRVRDQAGQVTEVVTVMRDVTQNLAIEAALAESEARYRMLADQATDIIVRYDTQGVIDYASPSVRQLGYAPEDLVGRSAATFDHPDDRARATAYRTASIEGRDGLDQEDTQVRRADGEWVWLQGKPSPMRDEAGNIIGVMTILRDVTARRAMEDELRRKQAEAEAATVAKAEFLANMSHEIRTPLTGIVGFAGLLDKLEGLPETARTYASRINSGSQMLLSVVNDVLDFSKMEAGQLQMDPQPFDPGAFVEETLELVRVQAKNKGLELHADLGGALPPAVRADSARVRQVLLNLLGNAIKFTSEGGVRVEVSHLPDQGGALRFAVTDTGVGISAENLDCLFQRFSQADGSIARRYGGTGLGLAICKGLAEMMGGEIGVESQEGRGSTFWFTVAAPEAVLQAPAAVGETRDWTLASVRILVVDDVSVNRELVSALLGPFSPQLTEAASGGEAIEAALGTTFDLILMDLQMPGMDGLEATRAIRATCELNRDTPILALSANVLPVHLEACREAGMDDHIAKPIRPDELLGKIAQWAAAGVEADESGASAAETAI
jgi:PAS domain S-box-containing protein